MDANQAWRDTICLLAGNPARRSSRPGERFDLQPSARKSSHRLTRAVIALATVLLALGVAPALLTV